jgi:hypothetical protein
MCGVDDDALANTFNEWCLKHFPFQNDAFSFFFLLHFFFLKQNEHVKIFNFSRMAVNGVKNVNNV